MGPTVLKYLQKCHWVILFEISNLKTCKRNFLFSVFKYPKMSNINQTLLYKNSLTKRFFFFLGPQFSVFKHFKLLFKHSNQKGEHWDLIFQYICQLKKYLFLLLEKAPRPNTFLFNRSRISQQHYLTKVIRKKKLSN